LKNQFFEFIEIYKKSGKKMEVELFKPIDLKKWLKLGFLSFLNQIPLFLFLFFLNFLIIPTKFLQWNKLFPYLPHIFLIFPFLFSFFLLFFFFFLYISSYSNYFYFEFLIGKKDALISIDNNHKNLSKSYFILSIFIYIILAFSLLFGFSLIIFFKEFFPKLFIFLFSIIYLAFFFLLNIFLKDFYIPLSYFKNLSPLGNLQFALKIISSSPLRFFLFFLIKTILIVLLYSSVLFMGIMSFGVLFLFFIIPVLGQTILQPIIYFLNIFGLNFFENFAKLEETLIKNG